MKPAVLVEDLTVDAHHQLHIQVPADMGRRFKVIVLPAIEPDEGELTPEATFLLAAYSAGIEEDPEEDGIWKKYVRD